MVKKFLRTLLTVSCIVVCWNVGIASSSMATSEDEPTPRDKLAHLRAAEIGLLRELHSELVSVVRGVVRDRTFAQLWTKVLEKNRSGDQEQAEELLKRAQRGRCEALRLESLARLSRFEPAWECQTPGERFLVAPWIKRAAIMTSLTGAYASLSRPEDDTESMLKSHLELLTRAWDRCIAANDEKHVLMDHSRRDAEVTSNWVIAHAGVDKLDLHGLKAARDYDDASMSQIVRSAEQRACSDLFKPDSSREDIIRIIKSTPGLLDSVLLIAQEAIEADPRIIGLPTPIKRIIREKAIFQAFLKLERQEGFSRLFRSTAEMKAAVMSHYRRLIEEKE